MYSFSRGFHYIELIVTTLILSILLCLSIPDLSELIHRHKNEGVVQDLFHTLQWVRSEAIKRNQVISLCASQNLMSCNLNWNQGDQEGYIVFIGKDPRDVTPENIIRKQQIYQSILVNSNVSIISFTGTGQCLSRGTLTIYDKKTVQNIVIYDSGRLRIESSPVA